MNLIDLLLGIPLAWAVYRGFRKGLILELAMLVGLVIGLYAGLHFSKLAAGFIKETFHLQADYLPFVSFIAVFILVLLGVYMLGKLLEKTAEAMMMGMLNKIGGAIFSVIKMALILSFILVMLNGMSPGGSIFTKEQQQKSYLYKSVSSFAAFLLPRIKTLKEQHPIPNM